MKTSSIARCGILCMIASLFAGLTSNSEAATLIDFESVPTGALASNALSAYGVSSITNAGGPIPASVRDMSGEMGELMISSPVNAFHPPAFFWPQTGSASATLTFATELTSLSFTKIAEANTANGVTYGLPGWSAVAYDSSNNVVDSISIGYSGGLDFPNTSIATYTLDGISPIDHVVFSVNYTGMSSSGTVYLDDFTLSFVPEPSTIGLVGAFSALALRRR